jgi:integrase
MRQRLTDSDRKIEFNPFMRYLPKGIQLTNVKVVRNNILDENEINQMLETADKYKAKYYKVRAKCLVAIARLTGKRRGELRLLLFDDVKVLPNGNIVMVFQLKKKRKKKKRLSRSPPKTILNEDPYAKYIKEYLSFIDLFFPEPPKYLFPQCFNVFGTISFKLRKSIGDKTVFNIIKRLNPKAWVHLFRETVGAEEIKNDPTLIGVFRVQRRLDLEDTQSAFRYFQRYATDIINRGKKETKDKIATDAIEHENTELTKNNSVS